MLVTSFRLGLQGATKGSSAPENQIKRFGLVLVLGSPGAIHGVGRDLNTRQQDRTPDQRPFHR